MDSLPVPTYDASLGITRREWYRTTYLASEHWQTIRQAALEHAGHRCQVCNADKRLDVHHRTYERLGDEQPGDLTVLCRRCHDLFHGAQPKPKKRKGPARTPQRNRNGRLARENEELHARQQRNKREQAISRRAREILAEWKRDLM